MVLGVDFKLLTGEQEAPYQVSADHGNEFVFNTEAHPIRIFGGQEHTS